MSITAILVDGGFYRKRANYLWGVHDPKDAADAMIPYCRRHLQEHGRTHELYRIFYYDYPPVDKQIYHPLHKKTNNLKASPEYKWMTEFLAELKHKRKVALRLGTLDVGNAIYTLNYDAVNTLNYDAVKKLCSGQLTLEQLEDKHFSPTIGQKGVDMKLGIDIASLAYKKQVDQIVLITGDSDFVPAAKLARREGIDVVLDPMEMKISPEKDLFEHIDGLRSCGNPYRREP